MRERVRFQFEYDQRIRSGFVGAGDHAFRNVYPALQYAPVDLRAVCDVREERAESYASMFGADAHHVDHRELLAEVEPTAVFIVTSYDSVTGRVQATDIALDCLRAGAHVWMEKPTAASVAEIEELRRVSGETGRFVMTGLKKIFAPAMEKVKEIISAPEFGPVSSITVRYPQHLPAPGKRDLLSMRDFLDHIYHPAAILQYLGGDIERFGYEWEPASGASVASLRFASGAIGSLHLAAGSAHTSPLERVEVIGRDANVVVDNGVRVTYYRSGGHREYGRSPSFLIDNAVAPLVWEPEFSLGQLYNKNLFYLGYAQEVLHFCESVLAGTPPVKGTLAESLAIMQLFEAYQQLPAGTVATLPLDPAQPSTDGRPTAEEER